jgi:hypothetical protein
MLKAVTGDAEINERDWPLCSMATECDRLETSLAEDARLMAELWGAYAAKVEQGWSATPPHRYSTVNDVIENYAAFNAKVAFLVEAIRLGYGNDGVNRFRDAGEQNRAGTRVP